MGRRVFVLPFNRDVPMDTDVAGRMIKTARACQAVGGVLLVRRPRMCVVLRVTKHTHIETHTNIVVCVTTHTHIHTRIWVCVYV